MLYMIEAQSTVDYSYITKKYGQMPYDRAILVADRLNEWLEELGSNTVFYPTPVLDI